MKNDGALAEELANYKADPEFRTEELILAINEEICRLMDEQKVNRAELARRLGVQRQQITKLLNGMPNLTLLTLVKVATALDVHVCFEFKRSKDCPCDAAASI